MGGTHFLRRDWLEVFTENSHCLQAAERLCIYYHDQLEADILLIIDKFRVMLEVETFAFF
jgi:hypothetical protein